MLEGYGLLCTAIAIVVGLCRYIIGAILRLTHPDVGITKDYDNKPTVSILLPCFMEGKHVYETIQSIWGCDYPKDRLEIIATDDGSSDDSFDWIQKASRDFPNTKAVRNAVNQGKTHTILNALAHSSADVVIIVDSDTTLGVRCITELMACLGDKRLGAVGAPALVGNPNVNALTAFQVYIYTLGFQLGKTIENASRSVGVIGGYCFAIRRELFESMREEMVSRRWFGCKVMDGEDRMITHLCLLKGHGTYMDMSAECHSNVPETFNKYWGQQLRWRRTTLRDFFFTLRRIPQHVRDVGVFSLYVYVLTPMIVIISIVQMVLMFNEAPASWVDLPRVAAFILYTFFAVFLVKLFNPRQTFTNPIKLLIYMMWWVVNNLLLAPLALFTLDAGDWGNRKS